jgi:sulfite reductase alpha subunit-like flavoprotein
MFLVLLLCVSVCLTSLLNQSNFLKFTFLQVFGLGNKTYEHFNEMGKIADTKLEQMGGTRICALGLGDDDGRFVVVSFI